MLAVALAGCNGGARQQVEAAPAAVVEPPSPASPAPIEVVTPVVLPSVVPPSPSASPSPSPSKSAAPKPSYDVAAVQRTLSALNYYGGAADGRAGGALASAVMAFQKVQGLPRSGSVNAATLAALASPKTPDLRGGPANRVEVDLTKQVLYVVKGGAVSRILPVSSGNGASYKQKNGATARALTPTGHYVIERRIVGERKADLGTLYDPQYFYRGWAIHGSNSVPAGPASHGCVRVTRADAKYLLTALSNGMSVHVYGGTHVFSAGSSAPGTDNPTGDGGGEAPAPPSPPAPAPQPQPEPVEPSSEPAPASPPPEVVPSP
jgi:lipoprotein-anchoring transpeptidase ErfK/SrfK